MARFFKGAGLAFLIAGIGLFLAGLASSDKDFWVFLSVFTAGLLGLLLIAVGDLMNRVDVLEDQLKISEDRRDNAPEIMQITCPNCGKECDMDYPKCPHCGYGFKQ